MKVKFDKKLLGVKTSSESAFDLVDKEQLKPGDFVAEYAMARRGTVNDKGKVVWDKPKA